MNRPKILCIILKNEKNAYIRKMCKYNDRIIFLRAWVTGKVEVADNVWVIVVVSL